eukprot:1832490-Prymnesium_polylepis.1
MLLTPEPMPAVSVRLRGQTHAECNAIDTQALHVGCFTNTSLYLEDGARREAEPRPVLTSWHLTHRRCGYYCDGSPYFGVYERECYCYSASEVDAAEEVDGQSCGSTECPGDSAELCGGSEGSSTDTIYYISIYRTPPRRHLGNQSSPLPCAFSFDTSRTPHLLSISPAHGAAANVTLTLSGSGFAEGTEAPAVTVGGLPCALLAFNDTHVRTPPLFALLWPCHCDLFRVVLQALLYKVVCCAACDPKECADAAGDPPASQILCRIPEVVAGEVVVVLSVMGLGDALPASNMTFVAQLTLSGAATAGGASALHGNVAVGSHEGGALVELS